MLTLALALARAAPAAGPLATSKRSTLMLVSAVVRTSLSDGWM